MKLKEAMITRRSIRRFKTEALSAGQVEELIEMAVTAPSASNKQPWRFFVTDERSIIDRMAEEVQQAVDRIVQHVPSDSPGLGKRLRSVPGCAGGGGRRLQGAGGPLQPRR